MIPFTPVNSLPHLLGGGGGGRVAEGAEEEKEGRRKKNATVLPVVISFGISVFLWLLLLAGFERGSPGEGQNCDASLSPFARHEP